MCLSRGRIKTFYLQKIIYKTLLLALQLVIEVSQVLKKRRVFSGHYLLSSKKPEFFFATS